MYHLISQKEPKARKCPGFSQIYIYDQEHEFENCLKAVSNLDKMLLKELQDMIKNVNPNAKVTSMWVIWSRKTQFRIYS